LVFPDKKYRSQNNLLILQKFKTMKKLILSGMLVVAIAVAAFSIYKNSSKEEELSDIVKANIEALAERADEPTEPPLANGGDLPGAGGGGNGCNSCDSYDTWKANPNTNGGEWSYKKTRGDNGRCKDELLYAPSKVYGEFCLLQRPHY
jgi:hypothetical protein